jgi:hypothetical protein
MDRNQETDITSEQPLLPEIARIKRPFSVTLLIVGVLIITVLNIIRFILSINYFGFLSARLAIPPIYLTITGFVWGLAGCGLIWGLWKVKTWAPRLIQALALTYALYYWLDQVFLSEHPINGAPSAVRGLLSSTWLFSAGVTVIALAYIAWIMNRSNVKRYFGISETTNKPAQGADIGRGDTDIRD